MLSLIWNFACRLTACFWAISNFFAELSIALKSSIANSGQTLLVNNQSLTFLLLIQFPHQTQSEIILKLWIQKLNLFLEMSSYNRLDFEFSSQNSVFHFSMRRMISTTKVVIWCHLANQIISAQRLFRLHHHHFHHLHCLRWLFLLVVANLRRIPHGYYLTIHSKILNQWPRQKM